MPDAIGLPAIPWSHTPSDDFGNIWLWETPAFTVKVNGDMRSFYWSLSDKTADPHAAPKPFADGQTSTFEQAERNVRETIGKAYPADLGYQQYAGSLAVTFSIATGETIDFSPYLGRKVTVKVASREGPPQEYVGIARVEHYDFLLINGPTATHITPTYILDITLDGVGHMTRQQPTQGRTFRGRTTPGCTGKTGYLPNTVDHYGLLCPIHEQ